MPKKLTGRRLSELLRKHGVNPLWTGLHWDNTALQAVRLVGELCATPALNEAICGDLQRSMDLEPYQLLALLNRIQAAWDEIKEGT